MNLLHWKKAPGKDQWHLTFDGYEALCGKKFPAALRNFSRDLAKGPPDDIHKDCQDVAAYRMGLEKIPE